MGKSKAATSQRAHLIKELTQTVKRVDEEGLLFLLRQAKVLVRNAEVEELNREADKLAQTRGRKAQAQPRAGSVGFEDSPDGKMVFLSIGGTRKVLSVEELKPLVRICYSAQTKSDALSQLFTYLSRERRDILADAGIGSRSHGLLEALFYAVRQKYKLKER